MCIQFATSAIVARRLFRFTTRTYSKLSSVVDVTGRPAPSSSFTLARQLYRPAKFSMSFSFLATFRQQKADYETLFFCGVYYDNNAK